jgi:hypothetical protein
VQNISPAPNSLANTVGSPATQVRKLLLCLGGAGLVWAVSGSPWAIAVLVGTCVLTFLLAHVLANAPNARWTAQTGRLARIFHAPP